MSRLDLDYRGGGRKWYKQLLGWQMFLKNAWNDPGVLLEEKKCHPAPIYKCKGWRGNNKNCINAELPLNALLDSWSKTDARELTAADSGQAYK